MRGLTGLPSSSLKSLLGWRIAAVARILYVYRGEVDRRDGALELDFEDGSVVLLDGAADGERLRVRDAPWTDPFPEPISAENQFFIDESGRWSRIELSQDPNFSPLVGEQLAS